MMNRQFISFLAMMAFGIISPTVSSQDLPPLPALTDSDSTNSLMSMLKNDLMKRYENLDANKNSGKNRPSRPRPELGKDHGGEEPIDISKYLGPDADPNKTLEKLQDLGRIPSPKDSIPSPPSATDGQEGLWSHVPPEKRFAYAQDLFKQRKYDEAQKELESLLNDGIQEADRFSALILREKCLFHRRFYGTVQDDYSRLTHFYPKKEKELLELKQYLKEKSGLTACEKEVLADPDDPAKQRQLLDLYEKLGWLDFGEEFFLSTINNTSTPTVKSLSEIYYKKQDYEMLIQLSRAGQKLHPDELDFFYNEGVGLYAMGDPLSRQQARDAFQNVIRQAPSSRIQQNAQWYLNHLPSTQPK